MRGRRAWTVAPALLGLALAVLPAPAPAADLEDLLFDLQVVPLDARPAPAFRLERLEGGSLSLADLRGRPAMLYFWATW